MDDFEFCRNSPKAPVSVLHESALPFWIIP